MRPELVPATPVPGLREGRADRDGLGVLTRRASLNAAAALLDYAARVAVGLVITPVLVTGLGRSLFGLWEMLQRLSSYLSATDGRPTEALRLVIAQHQSGTDDRVKQQFVGAALAVWCFLLPLALAAGALLLWLAPGLTHAPPELGDDVRLTCALLVGTFLLGSLGSVPESVLRGTNLGYKQMGVQAALNVLGGALMAAAVWVGLGLAGLGGALVIRAAATGLCFWLLARRYVRWFAMARPRGAEVRALFKMSVWLSAGDVLAKILLASDVVILGAVLGPAAVTPYVLTGYAARAGVGIHVFAAGAAIPGLGGVLGARQLARAARARRELLLFSWLFVTVVGATVLLWNRAFLGLWVGAEHYAGAWVNLLVVLIAAQTAFIRVDAYIIDAALRPRARVAVGAVAAVVSIGLGLVLTRAFGVIGLCGGVLAGRAVQSVAYPLLVRASLATPNASRPGPAGAARLAAVTAGLFAVAAGLGHRVGTAAWPAWGAGVVLSALLLTGLALALGPADARQALRHRLQALRSSVEAP